MVQVMEEISREQNSQNVQIKGSDKKIDYEKVASSEEFKQLSIDKKKFIVPYTCFYIAYSLLLPFLALYTNILNHPVVGDITWAWIYGVSFIPISLWVCSIYVKKAAYFDNKAREILEKEGI
ncbi:MAG TPA: DUF485 domain-containing protein [Chondromyces sp.]|nr:DUF485 domain-containing protein [Chondromyces sp.]